MFFVFTLALVALVPDVFASAPTLLVLSFENFHPEDADDDFLPFFTSLRKTGSGPAFITPIFPTTTFSTHFNIATGVLSDVHGVYNDSMFNKEGTVISRSKEQFQLNQGIVPIWTENQKAENGRISGVMMWPGSEHEYQGVTPTYVQSYDTNIEWSARADKIIEWMTGSDKKANLVMAYFEKAAECYDSDKKSEAINTYNKRVDDVISQIHTKLTDTLGNNFNMVIVSNYGTQEVNIEYVLKVENCIPKGDKTKTIVSGPLVFVRVVEESFNEVYEEMMNKEDAQIKYDVLKKTDIASKYGMNIPNLENVIILLAKEHYGFFESEKYEEIIAKLETEDNISVDMHGYDINNFEMTGYLAGFGPKFKEGIHTNDTFCLTEIYPMLKSLLELPNEPSDVQKNIQLNHYVKALLKEN